MSLSPRKILLVNDIGGVGGAEKILSIFVRCLNEAGFIPHVLFGTPGETYEQVAQIADAKVPGDYIFAKSLRRWLWNVNEIRNFSGETVILNTLFAQILYSPVAKISGKRVVWYQHNIQVALHRKLFVMAWRWLFVDHMIAVSQAVTNSYSLLNHSFNLSAETVIHNGIPSPDIKRSTAQIAKIRQKLGVPEGDRVLLSVSRLTPYKGVDTVVDWLTASELTNVTLLVVGDCGLSSKDVDYKARLINAALGDKRIKFLGWRDDVEALMQAADVFVAAAVDPDPFPTTVLEAMSMGCCCVVSNIGGHPEAISNSAGVVFEPGCIESLGIELTNLLSDGRRMEKLKANAKARFDSEFTDLHFRDRVNGILEEILLSRVIDS